MGGVRTGVGGGSRGKFGQPRNSRAAPDLGPEGLLEKVQWTFSAQRVAQAAGCTHVRPPSPLGREGAARDGVPGGVISTGALFKSPTSYEMILTERSQPNEREISSNIRFFACVLLCVLTKYPSIATSLYFSEGNRETRGSLFTVRPKPATRSKPISRITNAKVSDAFNSAKVSPFGNLTTREVF